MALLKKKTRYKMVDRKEQFKDVKKSSVDRVRHLEHPDGSWIQTPNYGEGKTYHFDPKSGKETEHGSLNSAFTHDKKLHEGSEQLDEISKNTLKSYLRKGEKTVSALYKDTTNKKFEKRVKYLDKASNKINNVKEDATKTLSQIIEEIKRGRGRPKKPRDLEGNVIDDSPQT